MFEAAIHNEIVDRSNKRCMEYGIEKNTPSLENTIKGNEFNILLKKNSNLIKIARPFMEILYDFLEGSGFSLYLTDKNGIVLTIIGDEDIIRDQTKTGILEGADMSEKSAGTNAIGTALHENCSVQTSGEEHFIYMFHVWTCSAAVIHNEEGNIIGCLNLTGRRQLVHPHTLGLVVAAVKSIENQIKAENTNNKLLETYEYMNTILDSISSGIYVVNKEGILKTINKEACSILGVKEEDVIEKNAEAILPNWSNIFERLQTGKTYDNIEEIVNNEVIKGRYNVSATPIIINNEVIAIVIMFKEMQNVLKLVNKYSGGRAVYNFQDIIGESKQIKKVINYAKTISSSPSTVLIEGESGTGKELLAQSIHNYSGRKNNTFIAVNCGAIPKNLIESELFGYEEGAFTGAKRGGHAGKFELSNGGTLFLDEIGEMPIDMQVKLLRVLQEGYVTRVGGDKIIPVDVRIIAATNKNLKEEVKKGRFREDLYYRLSVNPIKIPPLREREGDLPILIRYLFRMKIKKMNKNLKSINADIYKKMMNYTWPGNIRELENCIENVVNLDGKGTMFFEDNEKLNDVQEYFANKDDNLEKDKVYTLEELEKKEILKAINKNQHNMTKIAKDLGINRSTLYAKIKKYYINFDPN